MTELETRLRSLDTPTEADSTTPSLQVLALEAAARRSRHRSARVLAVAAVIVVAVGLAIVVVRRPQPVAVDTVAHPSVTTPQTLWPATGTSLSPGIQLDDSGFLSEISMVALDPPATSEQIDASIEIIRERLAAIGLASAVVSRHGDTIVVTFNGTESIPDPGALTTILIQDLPITQPGASVPPPPDTQP